LAAGPVFVQTQVFALHQRQLATALFKAFRLCRCSPIVSHWSQSATGLELRLPPNATEFWNDAICHRLTSSSKTGEIMKTLGILLSILLGSYSFALAQSSGATGNTGAASGANAGSSTGSTGSPTTGMQGTTGTNVGGSINSAQGVGSAPATSLEGPNNGTSRDNKSKQ
jgi:hypothetical protein